MFASLIVFAHLANSAIEYQRARRRVEQLFIDGCFKPGASADLRDWEAAFADGESVDPENAGRDPSVKSSSARMRTDDRTVLIVRFQKRQHRAPSGSGV